MPPAPEYDIGHGVRMMFNEDGGGIYWLHPECRGWFPLRFKPDPASTGHVRTAGGIDNPAALSIQGSLLCPKGCGRHGFITDGKWIPA